MKIKKEELIEAVKDLSEFIDFNINTNNIHKYEEEVLKEEIIEASLILDDGDEIRQNTVNVLTKLEVDIPAGIKIKKEKKTVEKKVVKKAVKKSTTKKVVKKVEKKTAKKKNSDIKKELHLLLLSKKYNQKEIKDLLIKKFPTTNKKRISDLLSCIKNKKYNTLEKLVVTNKSGFLVYEK